MQGVTLTFAVVGALCVLALPVRYAVIVYIGALVWYPSYLAVSIGTVDFTLCRIVILVLYAKIFLTSDIVRAFQWNWLDALVLLGWACQCVAGLITTDAGALLENRAGAAFDTLLPYFAVRLTVRSRNDYLLLLRSLLVLAAPLAIFGAYQCLTGHNPLGFFSRYAFTGGSVSDRALAARRGLWRAEVTFPMSIMFGLFFAMMGPLCAGLWKFVRQKWALLTGLLLMVVGMMSSMSSGPWLAGIVAMAVIAAFPFRRYWKTFVGLLVVWLGAIDVASNRHWYDVLGSFTLAPRTAWYRVRLMEVALSGGMNDHWIAGFGLWQNPGWGPMIDGRSHTDVVNAYLGVLVKFGLLGLIPFILTMGAAWARLRVAFSRAGSEADRWLVWGVCASLAGIAITMFSVSFFGQPLNLLFIVLGICGNAPILVGLGGPPFETRPLGTRC